MVALRYGEFYSGVMHTLMVCILSPILERGLRGTDKQRIIVYSKDGKKWTFSVQRKVVEEPYSGGEYTGAVNLNIKS